MKRDAILTFIFVFVLYNISWLYLALGDLIGGGIGKVEKVILDKILLFPMVTIYRLLDLNQISESIGQEWYNPFYYIIFLNGLLWSYALTKLGNYIRKKLSF